MTGLLAVTPLSVWARAESLQLLTFWICCKVHYSVWLSDNLGSMAVISDATHPYAILLTSAQISSDRTHDPMLTLWFIEPLILNSFTPHSPAFVISLCTISRHRHCISPLCGTISPCSKYFSLPCTSNQPTESLFGQIESPFIQPSSEPSLNTLISAFFVHNPV